MRVCTSARLYKTIGWITGSVYNNSRRELKILSETKKLFRNKTVLGRINGTFSTESVIGIDTWTFKMIHT